MQHLALVFAATPTADGSLIFAFSASSPGQNVVVNMGAATSFNVGRLRALQAGLNSGTSYDVLLATIILPGVAYDSPDRSIAARFLEVDGGMTTTSAPFSITTAP